MYGDAIRAAVIRLVLVAFVCGAIISLLLVFGLPALWDWIKPWLHAVTA